METARTRWLRSTQAEQHATLAPDGRLVGSVTGEPNDSVRLWEILTGKEIFLLKGHQGPVAVVAWSHDGCLVASAEERGNRLDAFFTQTVRLWNPATGKQLACFGGFQSGVTALTFSPDGTTLFAGLRNSTILIWEVGKANPRLMPPSTLTKDELASCWTDMISGDVGLAHQAIGALVTLPRQAVPFLQSRVKPTPVTDAGKVQQWIADLNSDAFTVRQLAAQELVKVDTQVVAPIQKTLKGNLSVETRRRLEQVLTIVSDVPDPNTVRTIRAIMALEKIGSPDARAVLQALAGGAPSARATEEAEASLRRLSKRVSLKHPS